MRIRVLWLSLMLALSIGAGPLLAAVSCHATCDTHQTSDHFTDHESHAAQEHKHDAPTAKTSGGDFPSDCSCPLHKAGSVQLPLIKPSALSLVALASTPSASFESLHLSYLLNPDIEGPFQPPRSFLAV